MNNSLNSNRVTNERAASTPPTQRPRYMRLARDYMCIFLVGFCVSQMLSQFGVNDGVGLRQVSAQATCPKFSCNSD